MTQSTLHNLHYAPGARRKTKRVGRGQGSGHGGTSTRGHKGEGARSGTHFRAWFEGGQMPLIRRAPKFGFHSPFKIEYQVVNVETLEKLAAAGKLTGKVTPEALHTAGAVAKRSVPVKILGVGDIKAKLEVTAHAFSKSAAEKIEKAGGKAIKIETAKK